MTLPSDKAERKSEILFFFFGDTRYPSRSTGLIIYSANTKVMGMNNTNDQPITINVNDIEEVATFIVSPAKHSDTQGSSILVQLLAKKDEQMKI